MSKWAVALFPNTSQDWGYTAAPLDIEYDVRQMTWVDQGTYGEALIHARGSFKDLAALARRVGHRVEVYDARGDCVWLGKFHRMMLRYGDTQYIITMEPVANKVALVYYKVTSEAQGLGPRTQTDWAEDQDSKLRYGSHAKIISRTKLTEEEAEAELARLLALYSQAEYTASPGGGAVTCELDCKGLWYYLQRQYYKDTSNLIASPESGGYSQNFGEGSGIDYVAAPFWTDCHLFSMIHWTITLCDTFEADAVTVKMNKVVSGYGDAQQPTDGVVCEICADDAYGVYFGDMAPNGNLTSLKLGAPRAKSGVRNQDGAWNGLWPGLVIRAWGGDPYFGQEEGAPDVVHVDRSTELPKFRILDWKNSGWSVGSPSWQAVVYDIEEAETPPIENWLPYIETGGFFTIPGPGAVLATSEVIPASQIPTSSGEVTFRFTTPFQAGREDPAQNRLWLRFRRTEAKDAVNKNWLSRGYYQIQGVTPQSTVEDVVAGWPWARDAEAYMLVHIESSTHTRWVCPIPGAFRNQPPETRMQQGASLWFKVSGTRQTDHQLYAMAVASEMFTQVIVESPYPGYAWGSGLYTIPYRAGDRTTQEEMQKLLDRGTSSGRGLIFEITPQRTAVIKYEPLPETAVVQLPSGRFAKPDGSLRPMFPPPIGQYVMTPTLFHLREAQSGTGAFYCKEASWDAESGLQLRPRTAAPLSQMPSLTEQ